MAHRLRSVGRRRRIDVSRRSFSRLPRTAWSGLGIAAVFLLANTLAVALHVTAQETRPTPTATPSAATPPAATPSAATPSAAAKTPLRPGDVFDITGGFDQGGNAQVANAMGGIDFLYKTCIAGIQQHFGVV